MVQSVDLSLCFVPQWSPFQPPLSVPSLAAWVRRAGFSCDVHDENVAFYDFLLTPEAVKIITDGAPPPGQRNPDIAAALDAIGCWRDFRADIAALLAWTRAPREAFAASRNEVLRDHYRAINSLATYLGFVSQLSPQFHISPYDFHLTARHALNHAVFERMAEDPPPLLAAFARSAATRILARAPRLIGLSCIGQEQLAFTLLIGQELKRRTPAPVIIGGTVLSRIAERGVLPPHWFSTFFDIVVRNEGEKPLTCLLQTTEWSPATLAAIPGLIFRDGDTIVTNAPERPLTPEELPIPDFDGMPLPQYLTSRVTLPLLSSRGCYWGKCEFCHHGMVYGEKYTPYAAYDVINSVTALGARYGTDYFAFNDEAIPPTVFRRLGKEMDKAGDTRFFTALIKFEPYFQADDFERAYQVGFRTLYVGLESASERLLKLMKKNTRQAVMRSNLHDATAAGIWMHCFLFFGFPGEQEADALETIRFVCDQAPAIGSFGAGTFSLEHNAPITAKLAEFGVRHKQSAQGDLDVYYDYEVDAGTTAAKAQLYVKQLVREARSIEKYIAVDWIPREHLLILRSLFSSEELVRHCADMIAKRDCGIFPAARDEWSLARPDSAGPVRIINRLNRTALMLDGASADILQAGFELDISSRAICAPLPWVHTKLTTRTTTELATLDEAG